MAFLESNCIRTALTPSVLNRCNTFSCGNEDLDAFFSRDAVKYSQQLMLILITKLGVVILWLTRTISLFHFRFMRLMVFGTCFHLKNRSAGIEI